MEISIKDTSSNETSKLELVIKNTLVEKPSLTIVRVNKLTVEKDDSEKKYQTYKLFKVHFIANCQSKEHDNLVVAFYLDDFKLLNPFIISGLEYYQEQADEPCYLIDYYSYCELCELTKENKMPIEDYLQKIFDGEIGFNSLVSIKEKLINYDEQNKIFDHIL